MNKKTLNIDGKEYVRGDIHDFLKGDLCTANLTFTRLREKIEVLEEERSHLISKCSKYPQRITKPTVWVRYCESHKKYKRCDESGEFVTYSVWGIALQKEQWFYVYKGIATVRIYKPPVEKCESCGQEVSDNGK